MRTVQVLGTGCAKCAKLTEQTAAAIRELGIDCQVEKVTEIAEIMKFGVLMTPALVVDGQVKLVGRVPGVEQIKQLLKA